jgi:hypothetical protein
VVLGGTPGLTLIDERDYGDTVIRFYRQES